MYVMNPSLSGLVHRTQVQYSPTYGLEILLPTHAMVHHYCPLNQYDYADYMYQVQSGNAQHKQDALQRLFSDCTMGNVTCRKGMKMSLVTMIKLTASMVN